MRIGPYQLTWGEVSGAFADLGVLIPLEASLIAVNGINPTSTLLGVGIAYIAAGLYFRIPMPVQPLKAFSVIAIAQALSPSVIAAGALLMSLSLFLLASTRTVEYLTRAVPLPVVRGVQFALGIVLVRNALGMVLSKPFLVGGDGQRYVDLAGLDISAGLLLGIGSLVLLLLLLWRTRIPGSVVVAALGVLVGIAVVDNGGHFALGPVSVGLGFPKLTDFPTALVVLVIPQLPLTLTNSVIATVDTAHTYYGKRAARVTPVRTSLSVAAGNLWAGFAGGLPMCHGSGGLTAHYRMGARTPAATAITGTVLILVALLFGRSALEVRSLMPYATLGALLFYVGLQHLLLGLKIKGLPYLAVVAIVGAVAAAPFGNLAIGAGVGMAVYWAARWITAVAEKRRRRAADLSTRV
ncbi:MAG: putative sulfate/molybdate transporter [Dehalococcoidia bacterium]